MLAERSFTRRLVQDDYPRRIVILSRTWALTEKLETRKQKLENGNATRMELGQSAGVSVNVGESEFESA